MFDKRKASAEPEVAVQPEGLSTSTSNMSGSDSSLTSRSTAMIGKTIQVKGNITGNENLVIEGTVDGAVELPQNDLTVGESGQVIADLRAKTVKVDGQVTGDISGTEKVVISKTGRVKGNIVSPRVTLEDGAKFKGSIDMDPGESKSGAAGSSGGPKSVATSKPPQQDAG